ncbi:MAG: hypothetical protein J7474_09830 [Arthrobacter sp.]|nr:hypothetical protein [Arthrobacter sp.]
MSGEHTAAGAKRALILALVVPLLAGCSPYAAPPDKSSMPWWTAEPTPTPERPLEPMPERPVFAPVIGTPDMPPQDFPTLPSVPATGPVVIDTSKLPQKVFLKVDRMTKPSWTTRIRGMARGQATYMVQCRGKGQIKVVLHGSVGPDYGFTGDCAGPRDAGTFGAGTQAPPDGVTDVTVTAPRGAQWALLVTQPAGS